MGEFWGNWVNSIDEIVGNRLQIEHLKAFAKDVNSGKTRKPLMIWGASGVGKTMAAHLLARWAGWNMVETNAGDYRGGDMINSRLSPSAGSRNLFGTRNALILDEIDELSGRFDKGAASALTKLINESKSPIIMIANNMWDQSISFLRGKTEPVQFRALTAAEVLNVIGRFADKNGIKISRKTMEEIAARSAGDARSAINDVVLMDGSPEEAIEVIGLRDRKIDVFAVLDRIFSANTFSAPIRALAGSDVDNEMMLKWIDENIPNRYTDANDVKMAYDMLSGASAFMSRASRSQYYTYWRYMGAMMSSGVALSKSSYPDKRKRYVFPSIISGLSSTKAERTASTAIAKKVQKRTHSSIRYIKEWMLPLISDIARNALSSEVGKEDIYDFFGAKFGLESSEVDYLVKNVRGNQAL